ncbi:RNA guanine-N7 methyltransferase activating subunit-like [Centruroides vittatus]|uniref:RNA guanine-N7 methyltransferase activating subunit-like n=1 Tax=Centruroides vittatus TaxID=120091 RepID=UPI00350F28F7
MGDQEESQKPSQLPLYEGMFKDRYTERDAEFVKLKETPLPPPPVVYPWEQFKRSRNDGYNRRQDRRYGGNRPYRDGNRDFYRDDRRDSWDRRDYRYRDDSPDRRRHSYGHSSRDNR